MSVAVVVVAAGRGERLGANMPKALVTVGGKPLLEHCLERITRLNPDQLVVTFTPGEEEAFKKVTSKFHNVKLVEGGPERQDSVANGLEIVHTDYVLIHDAARAFTPTEVFVAVAQEVKASVAVIPTIPVADTVKQVHDDWVVATVDRSVLAAAQTPQGFQVEPLREALEKTKSKFTDEAALVHTFGYKVKTIPGSEFAFKITTTSNLARAEQMFGDQRIGIGTDAHAFSDHGTLVLGTLEWPGLNRLAGHSDGDSIAHAIVDALLGAAGLGDIGSNFGIDRPEYEGAAGEVFLVAAVEMLRVVGLHPKNVSVQVVADLPKIGPRREELQQSLSQIIGCPVTVSATTTDGLGFLADSRGIAAVATALVARHS